MVQHIERLLTDLEVSAVRRRRNFSKEHMLNIEIVMKKYSRFRVPLPGRHPVPMFNVSRLCEVTFTDSEERQMIRGQGV